MKRIGHGTLCILFVVPLQAASFEQLVQRLVILQAEFGRVQALLYGDQSSDDDAPRAPVRQNAGGSSGVYRSPGVSQPVSDAAGSDKGAGSGPLSGEGKTPKGDGTLPAQELPVADKKKEESDIPPVSPPSSPIPKVPPPPPGVIPPPPPGSLPPPLPPVGGGAGVFGKQPLPPLSDQELTALTLEQQQASDALIVKALAASERPLKTFKAYRDTWSSVALQEAFKKRKELTAFLAWYDRALKKKGASSEQEFLTGINNALQKGALQEEGVSLIKKMLFESADSAMLNGRVEKLIINSVVVQRVPVPADLRESQKIASDQVVEACFAALLAKGSAITVTDAYALFNRLRVHPQFMRFAVMVAEVKGTQNKGPSSVQEELLNKLGKGGEPKQTAEPILTLLDSTAPLRPAQLQEALRGLFFFASSVEFEDERLQAVIAALLHDKGTAGSGAVPHAATGTLFNKMYGDVLKATDIARLRTAVKGYNMSLYNALNESQLTTDTVVAAFKQVLGQQFDAPLEKKIRDLVDAYVAQQQVVRLFAQELQAAVQRAHSTGAFQDASFLQALSAQVTAQMREQKKIAEFMTYFSSMNRVVFEVWDKVKSLITPQVLSTLSVSEQDVYRTFAPYGILIAVLQEFAKVGDYEMLITSLSGLNGEHASAKGFIRSIEPNYAPIIKTYTQRLLQFDVYKGRLTAVINAFKQRLIVPGLQEITRVVAQAQLNIEQRAEYKQLLEAVRTKVLVLKMQEILQPLQALNQGVATVTISQLARPGAVGVGRDVLLRNALVYEALQGQLTAVIARIKEQSGALAQLDVDAVAQKIDWPALEDALIVQGIPDAQLALKPVREYMQNIYTMLAHLKNEAQVPIH